MIAAAGFAQMAWELAMSRTYRYSDPEMRARGPDSRDWAVLLPGSPHHEYYRIVDNATASFNSQQRLLLVML